MLIPVCRCFHVSATAFLPLHLFLLRSSVIKLLLHVVEADVFINFILLALLSLHQYVLCLVPFQVSIMTIHALAFILLF